MDLLGTKTRAMHFSSSLCRFLRRKLWRKPRSDSMGMAPSAWMYSVSIQCRGWGSDDHSQEDSKPKIITYQSHRYIYIYVYIDIDYRLQIYIYICVCVCLMWYIFGMSYAVLHHVNHRVINMYWSPRATRNSSDSFQTSAVLSELASASALPLTAPAPSAWSGTGKSHRVSINYLTISCEAGDYTCELRELILTCKMSKLILTCQKNHIRKSSETHLPFRSCS